MSNTELPPLSDEEAHAMRAAVLFVSMRAAARISERFPQLLRKLPWAAEQIAEEFCEMLDCPKPALQDPPEKSAETPQKNNQGS